MRTLSLTVAYDGTRFHGWQVQPGIRTVQGILEEALKDVMNDGEIRLAGAGRTDAGVHARGQVASFTTSSTLPARAIAPLASRRLPDDVRVTHARDMDPVFHARHSATARRYAYRLSRRPDLLLDRIAWAAPHGFDVARLDDATRGLEVEADFSAFQTRGSSVVPTRCRVSRARWSARRGGAVLDIVADHFLYHMVRNIAGSALEVARAPDPRGAMLGILDSGRRPHGSATAPARGLCLERVYYEGERIP